MKIKRISIFKVELPLVEGQYNWSEGKSVSAFDSTVVKMETDEGITGYGEICPLGPVYLPSFAAGARVGIGEVAPHLIGEDPLQVGAINLTMDRALKGHAYVKSALDVACWDILGQKAGVPVAVLLGGKFGESVPLYRAISQDTPANMAGKVKGYKAEGYKKFQLKVGGNPDTDIERIKMVAQQLDDTDTLVADANTGWLMHEALRVVAGVQNIKVYIEQPCLSYAECLSVRQHTSLPFVLDECMDDIHGIMKGAQDKAMDVVNIKISKLGGLTKAKQARDLCVSLGIGMTIEDTWGGDIVTAAIAHLAHSTPSRFMFSSTDFNSYVTKSIATGAPKRIAGRMSAGDKPGLGIQPIVAALGDAVGVFS